MYEKGEEKGGERKGKKGGGVGEWKKEINRAGHSRMTEGIKHVQQFLTINP